MQLQWLYRIALGLYACTLTYLFFYGPRGWRDMYVLQAQIETSRVQTAEKQALVTQLTSEEQEWHTNSFKKERVAREELQMARAGDIVYYRSADTSLQ
jgi:cell division protein FtsB